MSDAGKQAVKAAFEIKKSPRQVMTLSETEVEKYLDPEELLDCPEGCLPEGRRVRAWTDRRSTSCPGQHRDDWPL